MRSFSIFFVGLVHCSLRISARTVFSAVSVNGVDQGHGVGVRVPSSNAPVTDIASDDLICNTNLIQPVSNAVIEVVAGDSVTAQFHHTSAGYTGPDPSDPLDPTNKGSPVMAYMAKVPSATEADVTNLEWFKIYEDGYTPTNRQWASDRLYINKGNATFTIPSCLASGNYLLRAESINLLTASTYPGAQFFMSCAQLSVTGPSDAGVTPTTTVEFPGAYTDSDPGIVTSIFGISTYSPPGPAVFLC